MQNTSHQKMAGRKERCSGCGILLAVPPAAKSIRCIICHAVTPVPFRPVNAYDQTDDPVRQATRWVKGMMNTVTNKIDSIAAGYSYNQQQQQQYPAPVVAAGAGSNLYYPPQVPRPLGYTTTSVHGGKKKAVLCGISYRSRRYELKGTINDVNCMKFLLVERFGFSRDSILILTEDEREWIPTKKNIIKALQWLIQDCKSGDSLVFHYSGHGSQKFNLNGDEIDGYDETLCPLDYEKEGMILDDEINATIVRPLPTGATLHAIIDSCHSGTVLDLPYFCRMNQLRNGYYWEDQSPPSGVYKGTSGGLAISFSACDDHQTSADTSALSGYTMTGAMTYSFIQAIQSALGLTYGCLLNAMRSAIRDAKTGIRSNGPITSCLRKLFNIGLSQEPQLSSSEKLDIYRKQVVL